MNTKEMLVKMLQENTGRHMLDSGGAYGRNWERNQRLPSDVSYWDGRPEATFKAHIYHFDDGTNRLEFDITLDLYHHLERLLEYDEEKDRLFQTWDRLHPDMTYEESMESFIKAGESRDWKVGEYGSGYTYNDDNILSQDFVWYHVDFGDADCIFLQIHGGCDARGGFTAPRIFQISTDDFFCGHENSYVINCPNSHYWDFMGGYEGNNSDSDECPVNKLEDYDYIDYDDLTDGQQKEFDNKGVQLVPEDQMNLIDGVRKFKPYSLGLIVVKDEKAYCPVCGGILEASPF